MKLFHRTPAGDAILRHGFRDRKARYKTDREWKGVFFADRPVGLCEGAKDKDVLVVDIPEVEVLAYEWTEDGSEDRNFREFCIPAALANSFGPTRLWDEDKDDSVEWFNMIWEKGATTRGQADEQGRNIPNP